MAAIPHWGKYRAFVHSINDPEKRGRVKVICPKILGKAVSGWCEPCVPLAYDNDGDFSIPKVGEAVWIEFEDGDVNYPVYTGSWWSANKTPSPNYDKDVRYISWGNCKVKMSKDSLELSIGSSIVSLQNSAVTITSPTVNLNSSSINLNGSSINASSPIHAPSE